MIKVMTDNAANLPPELRAQYAITELCLTYTIDGEPVDISKPFDGHAFYEAMRKGAEVKTSMITPLAAREAMEPVLDRGDDVLYVGLSGGVSGTCWGVSVVAQELRERYPDRDIRVLDSRGASLGEGLIVLEAADMAQKGADMETIVARVNQLIGKMRQHFMVDDLKFLRKGGRLSGAAAFAGTLLQIKPILQGDPEGKIVVLSKERGRKKAMDTLIRLYEEMVEDKSAPVGISHAAAPAEALHLATALRQAGCTSVTSPSPAPMWDPECWPCTFTVRPGDKLTIIYIMVNPTVALLARLLGFSFGKSKAPGQQMISIARELPSCRAGPAPPKAARRAALARFDNRPFDQRTNSYPRTVSAAASQEVQAVPGTDNVTHCTLFASMRH